MPPIAKEECAVLMKTSKNPRCSNGPTCTGQRTSDDLAKIKSNYDYGEDVRGFQWTKTGNFEGGVFLGDPTKTATAETTTKLTLHDTDCSYNCDTWFLEPNDYVTNVDVIYQQ